MYSIVVLTNRGIAVDTLKERAASEAKVVSLANNSFRVSRVVKDYRSNDCVLMVIVNPAGEETYPQEFEPEEVDRIQSYIDDPAPYVLTFNDLELLKCVIVALFSNERFVVADEDENITPGEVFLRGLEEDTVLAYLPRPYSRALDPGRTGTAERGVPRGKSGTGYYFDENGTEPKRGKSGTGYYFGAKGTDPKRG